MNETWNIWFIVFFSKNSVHRQLGLCFSKLCPSVLLFRQSMGNKLFIKTGKRSQIPIASTLLYIGGNFSRESFKHTSVLYFFVENKRPSLTLYYPSVNSFHSQSHWHHSPSSLHHLSFSLPWQSWSCFPKGWPISICFKYKIHVLAFILLGCSVEFSINTLLTPTPTSDLRNHKTTLYLTLSLLPGP